MNPEARQRRREGRKARKVGKGRSVIDMTRGKCKACRAECRAERGDVVDQYGVWMCAACYAKTVRQWRKVSGKVNMDIVADWWTRRQR